MAEPLVVVGAGGFGREVLDVIEAMNEAAPEPRWELVGVLDDDPTQENVERLKARGVPFLGGVDGYLAEGRLAHYVIGVGSPRGRRLIVSKFEAAGGEAATLFHPSATTGDGVTVGAGSVICAGVRLTTNIVIGSHVHLNLNATVGHDARLGDFVSVNPLASISGDCVIEDEVLIGVAGVVLNGLTVHKGSVVGGSACVVKDVPAGAVVKGVPAR